MRVLDGAGTGAERYPSQIYDAFNSSQTFLFLDALPYFAWPRDAARPVALQKTAQFTKNGLTKEMWGPF